MTSNDADTVVRLAVIGDWVPAQLADVLARQRAEEPETPASLVEFDTSEPADESLGDAVDFALSSADLNWPSWVCEPLWHDTLAVAVTKRSHLLIHPEVPGQELQEQPLILVRSTAEAPWQALAHRLVGDASIAHAQVVSTFDMAMTLVAAGYGIAIGPQSRLVGYLCRGIALRPLAGAPPIVMTYLLRKARAVTEPQERFARRIRAVS